VSVASITHIVGVHRKHRCGGVKQGIIKSGFVVRYAPQESLQMRDISIRARCIVEILTFVIANGVEK
jgi:hypothetical protein